MKKKDLKKESGGGELEEEKEISEDESTRGVIVEENEPTEDNPTNSDTDSNMGR